MTKQEIKEAIAKGIAGQGTNVDGGGYLPKILDAIVDVIPEGASPVAPKPKIVIQNVAAFDDYTAEQAAESLGITVDELNEIPSQLVIGVNDEVYTRIALLDADEWSVVFGTANTQVHRKIGYIPRTNTYYMTEPM